MAIVIDRDVVVILIFNGDDDVLRWHHKLINAITLSKGGSVHLDTNDIFG